MKTQSGAGRLRFLPFRMAAHDYITDQAMKGFLTQERIDIARAANRGQDTLFGTSIDSHHFDNSAFAEGIAYINEQWSLIDANRGKWAGPGKPSKPALQAFGRLLHAVQDFYSHSNWIELHEMETVPVWDKSTIPAGLYSGRWKKDTPANVPHHDEMNKDYPVWPGRGGIVVSSGPNKGQTYHELAMDAALRATRVEVACLIGKKGLRARRRSVSDVDSMISYVDGMRRALDTMSEELYSARRGRGLGRGRQATMRATARKRRTR